MATKKRKRGTAIESISRRDKLLGGYPTTKGTSKKPPKTKSGTKLSKGMRETGRRAKAGARAVKKAVTRAWGPKHPKGSGRQIGARVGAEKREKMRGN